MVVDAGELIGKLRDRLALKVSDIPQEIDTEVMAAFDRAALEAILDMRNGQKSTLSPQQRGARTRKANRERRGSGTATGDALASGGEKEGAA